MKFLQELVQFNRLDDEQQDLLAPEGVSADNSGEKDAPLASDDIELDDGELEPSDDTELVGDEDTDAEFAANDQPTEPEDPNRQGMIRTVKGAHLVYKREVEDGTYEELWIYNASTLRDEITIRKAVLAGTDIPVNKSQSPDGAQSVETWVAGNAELMLVKGLPQ